ncbi:ABC transporter ATP-binding protein [Limosilactobacillus allomucosae]|uniref:ABC transporter ATP-binding protein n=1 Tax=Limosilactobacillus allomucosae TaxID=3142938 RepID=A0ABV0I505_9LACO
MRNIVSIENISKDEILHDISFELGLNEKLAIIGSNGVGKSTLLKLLVGILQPSKGKIKRTSDVAMVFQSNLLDKNLSIRQNLVTRLGKEKYENAKRFLGYLGIKESINNYGNLSGGQKRMVDLARALMISPDLLILDELSAGMDLHARKMSWNFLQNYIRNTHMSIIYTTHNLDELSYADKILFIKEGKVSFYGATNKFLQKLPSYKLIFGNEKRYFNSSKEAISYIFNKRLENESIEICKVSYDDLFDYMEEK